MQILTYFQLSLQILPALLWRINVYCSQQNKVRTFTTTLRMSPCQMSAKSSSHATRRKIRNTNTDTESNQCRFQSTPLHTSSRSGFSTIAIIRVILPVHSIINAHYYQQCRHKPSHSIFSNWEFQTDTLYRYEILYNQEL